MKAMMRMRKTLTITSCTLVESSIMPSSEICVFCLLFDFMCITLPDYKSTHCYHYYIKGKFIAFYLICARSWVRKVEASHSVQTDSTHRASAQSSPTNPNVLSLSCHFPVWPETRSSLFSSFGVFCRTQWREVCSTFSSNCRNGSWDHSQSHRKNEE